MSGFSGSGVDPAFAGVGQEEGLVLWRIENKQVVRQPEVTGKFYTGDSYILLATTKVQSRLEWKLHFWLGEESSQDEMGIAAYKTVELDESLGGGPVQYREVQGHESSQFLSYFKHLGVEYLKGGVASGFKKVERDVYPTRLLHLKGKRVVRVNEVNCSASSLNIGDVFILDKGLRLFLWNGPQANKFEKAKGVEMVGRIRDDERGARAQVIFVHEDPDNAEFWEALGGKQKVTHPGEPDEVVERVANESVHLYKVSDSSGNLQVDKVDVTCENLTRDNLDSSDVFILDVGHELFVWVGKHSSAKEKRDGMQYAAQFIEQNGRPKHTPVVRVMDGTETAAFKSFFTRWAAISVNYAQSPSSGVAKSPRGPVDHRGMATRMASRKDMGPADEKPVDDGSGKLQIWRVEDFKKAEWPQSQYGQFYSGDSFVLLYTYMDGNKEAYLIYFWQGRDSSQDEKGASALLAKELDDSMGGAPVQVRVVQGKEPKHFRSLFKGRMVVHVGGKASGFKNRADADSYDTDGISLFHVKGTNALNTYGVQVAEKASSLNSGDGFVLLTPTHIYTWKGRKCSDDELAVAEAIAEVLQDHGNVSGRQLKTIEEGSEPQEFWDALGGKTEYPSRGEAEAPAQEPRLFLLSNATGVFAVEEVENFDQEDLCDDDVMLLDTFTEVFVWIGSGSNETERREALTVAQQYIDTATDGRSGDTPIVVISAGSEPSMFTQHFRGWDSELTKKKAFVDPYEAKLAALKQKQGGSAASAPAPAPAAAAALNPASYSGGFKDPSVLAVPYEELKGLGKAVAGVDPSIREQYLDASEFMEVFGMSKSEFSAQPKWKQTTQKKAKDLF